MNMNKTVVEKLFKFMAWDDLPLQGLNFEVEVISGANTRDGASFEIRMVVRPLLEDRSMFNLITLIERAQSAACRASYSASCYVSSAESSMSNRDVPRLNLDIRISNHSMQEEIWKTVKEGYKG